MIFFFFGGKKKKKKIKENFALNMEIKEVIKYETYLATTITSS